MTTIVKSRTIKLQFNGRPKKTQNFKTHHRFKNTTTLKFVNSQL